MAVSTPGILRALLITVSSLAGVTTRDLPSALTADRNARKSLVLMASILMESMTTISPAAALADRADFIASLLTFLFRT